MPIDTWPDGVVYRHISTCESTQDEVASLLAAHAESRAVVVRSDVQTSGRGRHGRHWASRAGDGVLLSIGLAQSASRAVRLDALDLRCAHVVADTARQVFGLDHGLISIKAPNDLLDATGAKLAGVLVDVRSIGGAIDRIIVGVGLNLRGPPFTVDARRCTTMQALAPDIDWTQDHGERSGQAIAMALLQSCLTSD